MDDEYLPGIWTGGSENPRRATAARRFLRGLSVLMEGGVTLSRSLAAIGEEEPDTEGRACIRRLRERVMSGWPLSRAMAEQPDRFSRTTIGLVRAGEVGGVLEKILRRYLDSPSLFVSEIPQSVTDRRPPADPEADRRRMGLRQWFATLAILLEAGVPVPDAMETSAGDIEAEEVREVLLMLWQEVMDGRRLSEGMALFPEMFGPVTRLAVEVAEQSGDLIASLLRLEERLAVSNVDDFDPPAEDAGLSGGSGLESSDAGTVAFDTGTGESGSDRDEPDRRWAEWLADVIRRAMVEGASDLHIQTEGDMARVRMRNNGNLRTIETISEESARVVVRTVKEWSGIPGTPEPHPRRGRIEFRFDPSAEPVDLRATVQRYDDGEAVAIRFPSVPSGSLGLTGLGMGEVLAGDLAGLLRRPCGVLVVAGVRGSGITTTLYSLLDSMRGDEEAPGFAAFTIEDTIERRMPWVRQVRLDPASGLGMEEAWRHIMEQDPDILMVGEARDKTTVAAMMRAAATGHLILCGVIAHDAVAALERVRTLDTEFNGTQLLGILAGRLFRRSCPSCRGNGCDACRGTGSRGRIGVYELLSFEPEETRRLLNNRAAPETIFDSAKRNGMIPIDEEAQNRMEQGDIRSDQIL